MQYTNYMRMTPAVVGPSDIPFSPNYPKPRALTASELDNLEEAYAATVRRCKIIGCKIFYGLQDSNII